MSCIFQSVSELPFIDTTIASDHVWGLNGSSLRSSTDWNTKVRPSGIEVKKLEKKRCEESAATAAAATVAAGTSAAEKVLVGHTRSKVCWQHRIGL